LESIIKISKLKCNLEKGNQSPFFSLVDYRNNLFTSNDPKKIMEFYDGFKNRYQLIEWMKESLCDNHEIKGKREGQGIVSHTLMLRKKLNYQVEKFVGVA